MSAVQCAMPSLLCRRLVYLLVTGFLMLCSFNVSPVKEDDEKLEANVWSWLLISNFDSFCESSKYIWHTKCVSNYFNLIELDDLTNSFMRVNIGEGKGRGRAKYYKKKGER